jgi:hypothetical protein
VTRTSTGTDQTPIYEDLVRERGDAVAEAQLAAEHTQYQAAELLSGGQYAHRQPLHRDDTTGAPAAGGPQQHGSWS